MARRDGVDDTGWIAEAVCRGLDPNLFHPEDDDVDGQDAAKAVCGGCPVLGSCLDYALGRREKHGIWGGLDERERRRILRWRRQNAPALCRVEGCDRPATAGRRGWCASHYARWHRTGNAGSGPIAPRRPNGTPPPACTLEGCNRPVEARGLCRLHWWRWYRTGNPGAPGAVA